MGAKDLTFIIVIVDGVCVYMPQSVCGSQGTTSEEWVLGFKLRCSGLAAVPFYPLSSSSPPCFIELGICHVAQANSELVVIPLGFTGRHHCAWLQGFCY